MSNEILLIVGIIAGFLIVFKLISGPRSAPKKGGEASPAEATTGSKGLSPLLARINTGRDTTLDKQLEPDPVENLPDPSLVTRAEVGGVQNVEALEALLERTPDNAELINLIAYSYYNNRRLDDALILYERGLQLRPDDPVLLLYMGNTLYLKGRLEPAREAWVRVTQVNADGKMARKAQERLSKMSSIRKPSEEVHL